ncbi:hypothetical protein [Nonomuraea sp. NPDC049400]|uniref:hypothetical protein n=1 Tax=Nonomuraea sp. NPDC049400 TaxID=3364352 RepID=UPI0037B3B94C
MSAIVLALGLAGAGVTPFIMQSASASVSAYEPVDPCDASELCDSPPETTVTVTETAGTPEPEQPETTVTRTVTSTPKKPTKTPTPKKTTPPPATTPPQSTPTQNLQPLPTQNVEVPETSASPSTTAEASVDMPSIAPVETATSAPPTPTETQPASSEEVPLELRNAAPEFDQKSLAQKLSIPALVLVLLALFAVLIFEGRLRRMAHAAAVRKAGPQPGRPDMPPGGGYPAGPGYYATAGFPAPGYPGGTAYAPIISFVPVQTYPAGPAPVYEEPAYPPQGYVPEPPAEPVVLHPDEFDSYNHEPPTPKEYRDPFEPLVPPAPPADIPPGGSEPYEGKGQERPLGPASAAEPGDAEPWQGQPLFQPESRQQEYEPPPYLAPEADVTAIQPLPQPQAQEERPEPTKEMPDPKRRRWGRKK